MAVKVAVNSRLERVGVSVVAGAEAGLVLLIAECAIGVALGGSPLAPPRLAAAAALGAGALSPYFPAPGPLLVGIAIYALLGAVYGLIAGVTIGSSLCRRRLPIALILGGLFGMVVWVLNGIVVGSFVVPQVAALDLLWQGFFAHAIFFGGVLALRLRRGLGRSAALDGCRPVE
jgi:hypothetical protein